ncbi:MAG TPA: hypothetical protein PLL77_15040 [Pyrinomonadaceae bacterium]|nr:hypothetical protein [Pyrinomonadaceae bacterium]
MLKKLFIISSVLFALTISASAVSAQNWVNLGSRTVNDQADHDTWNVGAGRGEFRKIKLTVQHRAVRFIKLKVKFENGQTQDIELRDNIPAGGSTRIIDLVGTDRRIDKVDVWYEAQTVRRGARSQVTLHGMK